jgi:hypothetical protein
MEETAILRNSYNIKFKYTTEKIIKLVQYDDQTEETNLGRLGYKNRILF